MQRPGPRVHLGVFLKPIMADMGWQRGTASFCLVVWGNLLCADRTGARPDDGSLEHSPGGIARSCHLRDRECACLGLSPKSLVIFHAAVRACRGGQRGSNPDRLCQSDLGLVYDRRRGLALGIAMSGVVLGGFINAATRSDADRAGGLGAAPIRSLVC